MKTQIRLLLEEQSDQCLHCLLFRKRLFDEISEGLGFLFKFWVDFRKVFWRLNIKNFMVFPNYLSDD